MSNPPARMALKPAQLRLLAALGDHGQLQLAAEACAITQPAASRMLAEIERLLGAVLFLRQPKGLAPTEAGRLVLRRSALILREMNRMGAEVAAMREGDAGTVRVGAVTGPAVSYLVAAIREVKAQAPTADITVEVLPSSDLLRHLAASELDFAVGRILPEYDANDFDILPMRDERVSFLVRASHPLAHAPLVTLTELVGAEWIMQQRGAPIRETTLQAFAAIGLPEPANIVNTPSLLFTIAYLAQSDAVAPMSEEVADLLIHPPVAAGLRRLTVPGTVLVSPYYLLSLRRRPLSPLAQRLRAALIAHSDRAALLV
ncbi:LysR family transcriptional regulator [Paracoccus xiamenensis]|uniref:LysR family transcriptional regulator n=1 Tax=Paracoccus xiamenensis TaxID=2714901 RepID=UPI00140E4DC6|nr:LysR family transcriptional regulator [Paracoccus xiamenensis]NHF74576.1 LysR family transcriptional regulator [Paracoccus xiamenensis]